MEGRILMKRHKTVKKIPVVLLAGMMAISMAPWTVYAETPGNVEYLDGKQGGAEEVSLMNIDENGSGTVPQEKAGGSRTDTGPQDETGNNEADADPYYDETNKGEGEVPQSETDKGKTEALQDETNKGEGEIPQDETNKGEANGETQDTADQSGADDSIPSGNLPGEGNQGDGSLPEGMPGDLGSLTGGAALSQVDPATGIAADADENVFPVGTLLYVTPVESGEGYDQISTLMSMIADQFKVYDIRFINMMDYSMTEPAGTVRISIPVPEGFDTANFSVSKFGEDGTRAEISFEITDGKAVFETDSAGTFLISQMKKLPESLAMTEKTARVELIKSPARLGGSSGSGVLLAARQASPKTGDNSDIAVWVGLMGAAVVVIIVFAVIKRKK